MSNIQDFDTDLNDPVRATLGAFAKPQIPAYLLTSLQVTASKECARANAHRTVRDTCRTWGNSLSLWYTNMMRPLALPCAGGLTSAMLMFGLTFPQLISGYKPPFDTPPTLYEEAEVAEMWPFGLASSSKLDAVMLVVDVTIDQQGRMISYSVPNDEKVLLRDNVLRRSIENNLLITKFKPANFFGSPTQGKLRLAIQHSRMEVKG